MGNPTPIDYLTCGSCLKEFPLQKITSFIQHKKLDCEDGAEGPDEDPGITLPVQLNNMPTVKPVLSGHSKLDKTNILMTNGS